MRMQQIKNSKVIFPELSYKICGLCFKVHNKLGRFRNEKQYADALEDILKESKISHIRELPLPDSFNGERKRRNIPDFIIENKIVVDFKAKRIITKEDYFQMRRYLASSKYRLGIIINFRQKVLSPKRVLNTEMKHL